MGKLEIFAQINRLVSNGLKKAAAELLTEYLEKHPDSVIAHKALGQVYLKSGQPRKAVYTGCGQAPGGSQQCAFAP